jgi:signal transduction histidine kinase
MLSGERRETPVFRFAALKQLSQRSPSVSAVFSLAGVMVLATVLSAAGLMFELREEELDHARGEVTTLARVLSEQTARTFDGVAMTLRGANERLSDDVGARLDLGSVPVTFILQGRSAGLPHVKSIFVADSDGRGVNSSRADFIPRLDVSQRSFFRYFADGGENTLFVSHPEMARVDDQWTFYVSTRLTHPDRRFRGVLVAAINIGYFASIFDDVRLDFVSRIQLLNLDGALMAGKPNDGLELGKAPDKTTVVTDLHAMAPGSLVEARERFADGLRLVAYRRTGDFPLAMRVAIDEHEALTPWRRLVRPIVGGLAAVLFFVLATAFLLARNLARKDALEAEYLAERQRAESELRESNRQLQSLSASLQNYREEERTRIARELHDELGQLLTGIRMEVSWLGGRLLPEQSTLADKVTTVKGQIDRTIATVRRISSELRPLVLDDLGLSAAASWYADQFSSRTGLVVELSLPDVDPERGDAVATALFRVLQESLTNVARHAQAEKVTVCLAFKNGVWSLSVSDDGLGFIPKPGEPGDIGLVGMRERAQNLGGRFSVTSAPGQGTRIDVAIPATHNEEGQAWKK